MSLFRVWSLEFRVISGWQVGHLSHSSASVSQRDVGPLFCWRNKWSLWSWCRCSHGCSAWTAASSSQRSSQAFPTQAWYCYDGENSLCIVDGGTPQAYFTFALFAASFCSLWLRSLWTKLLHARLNTKLGRILVAWKSRTLRQLIAFGTCLLKNYRRHKYPRSSTPGQSPGVLPLSPIDNHKSLDLSFDFVLLSDTDIRISRPAPSSNRAWK